MTPPAPAASDHAGPALPELAQIRKLAGQTLTYGVGAALGKLLGLLLVPIYTRALSPAEYGAVALLAVLASLLQLAPGGLNTAFLRYYYQYPAAARDRLLATNASVAILLCTLPASLALALAAAVLARPLLGPAGQPLWLWLLAAGNMLEALLVVVTTLYRAQERPRAFVWLSVGRLAVAAALNIALVVGLHLGVTGVVGGNTAAAGLLLALVGVPVLWRHLGRRQIDWRLVGRLLRYGLPLLPAGAAWWSLNFSDRFFLEHFATMHEVGLYSLGYAFGFVVAVAALFPFQTAWSPFMFSLAERPEAGRVLARAGSHFIALTAFLVLALSALAGDLIRLVAPPPYWPAYRVVAPVALAYGLLGVATLWGSGIMLTRRTEMNGLVYGAVGIVNLALNYLLIPHFRQMGAAWATLLSAALLPAPLCLLSNRLHHLPWEWGRLARVGVCGVACYAAAAALPPLAAWALPLRALAVAAFPALLGLSGFYRPGELAAARSLLRRRPAAEGV